MKGKKSKLNFKLLLGCALLVACLVILLVTLLSPAGKTYTYKNGDHVDEITFDGEKYWHGDSEMKVSYELEDGIIKTVTNAKIIDIGVDTFEFKGLSIYFGEMKYTSTGAIIWLVIGILSGLAGAFFAVTNFVKFKK